jgi:cell division protein FtsI (penicillin-binding protein 3)
MPTAEPLPSPILLARRRAGWVVCFVGVAWLLVIGRLVQLQVWQQVALGNRAVRQREFVEEIAPRPGDILDRQGRLLATTVRARSLFVIPSHIPKPWTAAQELSTALHLDGDELFERLGRHADKHFLWIKRRLSDEEADRIRDLNLPGDWWGFRDEFRRVYPQGAVAAQTVGLRDIDGIGRGGVEESCDEQLRGTAGRRVLKHDALGRVIDVVDDPKRPASDGQSVRLTLDTVVQLFVERELDKLIAEWHPENCCAVVLDPQSGDVLAMASRPTFDPNHPEAASPEAWTNRVIADMYEPGSTFKPCMVAYGLDQGVLHTTDTFDCEYGQYRMGRRLLHDHHGYGTLNLRDVLVKSSNIGMAKIGERLTNDRLHAAATAFGFGRKTGIELPGELPGILRPLNQWTSYSTGSIPMGHEIATTPLQLITAHAAIANGGTLNRPRLVISHDRDLAELRQTGQPIVARDVARWLIEVPMHEVVTRGTGRKAQVPGYDIFGKTGTAQKLSPQGGYQHGRYIASFVCGGPVAEPRAIVLVVVNQASAEGGEAFGGRVAAPVAAEILRQTLVYLRVSPNEDLPPAKLATPGKPRTTKR